MIRVTLEMIPHATGEPRHLGTIEIANDGTGTVGKSHYVARLSRRGAPASTWRTAAVRDFPRRSANAYELLYRVLREALRHDN